MENNKDILRVRGINEKGYGIIPKLVMQDRRLSRDAKCIYAYMRSFSGAGDSAFPGVSKICYDLGFGDEKTFRKHRKQLEDYGYITIEQKQSKETGRFCQNIYIINEYLIDPSTNPENQASSPSGDSSMTVNLPDGKSPSRQNHPTNNNSNLKLTVLQKQQQQGCCDDVKNKEIKEIMYQYDIKISDSKTLSVLSEFSVEELNKIGSTLQEKKKEGVIINPVGILIDNPKVISDSILKGEFYPSRPDRPAETNYDWTKGYELYVP